MHEEASKHLKEDIRLSRIAHGENLSWAGLRKKIKERL